MFECRCLLLLLLLSLWRVNADIRGRLLIRVACYDHPSNLRSTGRSCDVDSDCDPKFRFCLSSRPQSAHNCELERLDPFSFENTQKLGECVSKSTSTNNFPAVISVPVSADTDQLFLTVDLDDVDRSHFATRSSEIDRFRFDLFPGLPSVPNDEAPSRSSYAPLNISARDFHGAQQPRLQLLGVLVCAPSRFGPRCTSFCQPTPRYTCTANGTQICKQGWRGQKCNLRDPCGFDVCGPNGRCLRLHLKNNSSEIGMKCLCKRGFIGPYCTVRMLKSGEYREKSHTWNFRIKQIRSRERRDHSKYVVNAVDILVGLSVILAIGAIVGCVLFYLRQRHLHRIQKAGWN